MYAFRFFLSIVLGFIFVSSLRAEEGGFISGTVLDVQGGPVPDANISIVVDGPRYLQRLLTQPAAKTTADGRFRIGPLAPGKYGVFLFGAKTHAGFGAKPVKDVEVSKDQTADIKIHLQPLVEIKIPFDGPAGPYRESIYWIKSEGYPLQGNRSVESLSSRLHGIANGKDKLIKISTLPGKISLSADPSFHSASEVFEFTVTDKGELIDSKRLPDLTKFVTVDFNIKRTDGKRVDRVKVYGIPEFARYDIAESEVEQGGGSMAMTGFRCMNDPKKPNRYLLCRGIAGKMLITAHGCQPLLTPLIVPYDDMMPIDVVLEPAQLVDVIVQTEGLPPLPLRSRMETVGSDLTQPKQQPDAIEPWDQHQLRDFQSQFQEPSGMWLSGWIDDVTVGNSPTELKLHDIPHGTRIQLRFHGNIEIGGKEVSHRGKIDFVAGSTEPKILQVKPHEDFKK